MQHQLQMTETTACEQAIEEDLDTRFPAPAPNLPSAVIGRLVGLEIHSPPLVDFQNNNSGEPVPARSTIGLRIADVGAEVVLAFEEGDPSRPIILGVVQPWAILPPQHEEPAPGATIEVHHDPETLLLTAAKEITLRCGKASITLTNAGKLLLRGAYLLSRSSGVNRIKGGSVQIN